MHDLIDTTLQVPLQEPRVNHRCTVPEPGSHLLKSNSQSLLWFPSFQPCKDSEDVGLGESQDTMENARTLQSWPVWRTRFLSAAQCPYILTFLFLLWKTQEIKRPFIILGKNLANQENSIKKKKMWFTQMVRSCQRQGRKSDVLFKTIILSLFIHGISFIRNNLFLYHPLSPTKPVCFFP